jgi:hypothetical protein
MAFELQGAGGIMSLLALTDMTGSQYLAVAGDVTSGQVTVNTAAGSRSLGILQNNPRIGQPCSIWRGSSISKWVAGATIAQFASVTTDGAGKAKTASGSDIVHGVALEAGVTGALVTVALGGI